MHKAETDQQILDAAKKLFLSKGFFQTEMRDIAQKANCGRSTLYRYYKDKDSILLVLMSDAIRKTTAKFEEQYQKQTFKSAFDKLTFILRTRTELLINTPEYPELARCFDLVFSAEYPNSLAAKSYINFIDGTSLYQKTYLALVEGQEDKSIRTIDNPKLFSIALLQSITAMAERILPRESIYLLEYGYGKDLIKVHTESLIESCKAPAL